MDNKDNYFKSEEFKDILHRYEEAENSGRHEYLGSDELTDIAEYYYNLGRKYARLCHRSASRRSHASCLQRAHGSYR